MVYQTQLLRLIFIKWLQWGKRVSLRLKLWLTRIIFSRFQLEQKTKRTRMTAHQLTLLQSLIFLGRWGNPLLEEMMGLQNTSILVSLCLIFSSTLQEPLLAQWDHKTDSVSSNLMMDKMSSRTSSWWQKRIRILRPRSSTTCAPEVARTSTAPFKEALTKSSTEMTKQETHKFCSSLTVNPIINQEKELSLLWRTWKPNIICHVQLIHLVSECTIPLTARN